MSDKPERKLIEIRIGVEWQVKFQYWLHRVFYVWEYPDGSKRIVDSGHLGFVDAEMLTNRWIKCKELPHLPPGPLSGNRIRAKGGPNDEPFACDAESWDEGEHWTACDLGIPGGALGTIGGYDAERDEYYVGWDDGEKWGDERPLAKDDTRPACKWSNARDWLCEADILTGAELVDS